MKLFARTACILGVSVAGFVALAGGCSKSNDICSNCNNTTNNYITQTVGPNGAKIDGPDGLVVTIPAGALVSDTEIKIGTAADGSYATPPSAFAGKAYGVQPHGLMFAQPVQIYLPDPTNGTGVVYQADNESSPWKTVAGVSFQTVNGAAYAIVTAPHFSLYAIASGGGAGGSAAGPACNPSAVGECFVSNTPACTGLGTNTCTCDFGTMADGPLPGCQCVYHIACGPENCSCTYGDGLSLQTETGTQATVCVDANSVKSWANTFCKPIN